MCRVFPAAAFFLAAKAHAPVVPFFLTRGKSYRELQIEFGTVVRPQRPARWRADACETGSTWSLCTCVRCT